MLDAPSPRLHERHGKALMTKDPPRVTQPGPIVRGPECLQCPCIEALNKAGSGCRGPLWIPPEHLPRIMAPKTEGKETVQFAKRQDLSTRVALWHLKKMFASQCLLLSPPTPPRQGHKSSVWCWRSLKALRAVSATVCYEARQMFC